MSTLYLNGVIHSVSDPYATAMIVEDGLIAWVGADDSAERMLRATGASDPHTVDLRGALVTPAFVDSWSTSGAEGTAAAERGVFLTAGPHGSGAQVAYQQVGSTGVGGLDDGCAGWALNAGSAGGEGPDQGAVLSVEDALQVLGAATERRIQTVVVPQDARAAASLVDGLSALAGSQGPAALGRVRHRLVWNGPLSPEQVQALSGLSVSVTLVPDEDGSVTVPVGGLLAAGVPVSWGSGARAADPWALVRAVLEHAEPDERISARGGFTVATRSGLRVLPDGAVDPAVQMAGRLAPSSPATFAVWDVDSLSVQAPDGRVSAWSTDTRAGTPLLPVLDAQTAPPTLRATVVGGTTVHGSPDRG